MPSIAKSHSCEWLFNLIIRFDKFNKINYNKNTSSTLPIKFVTFVADFFHLWLKTIARVRIKILKKIYKKVLTEVVKSSIMLSEVKRKGGNV